MVNEGLIQYVCERCHTRFVLALSSRRLSLAKRLRAGAEAARRAVLHRDASYAANLAEATRRIGQVQADAEYERFRRSFNFCHNCRQFVCSDCWNDTNRQCLTCAPRKAARAAASRLARGPVGPGPVAPTLEPDGPQIARPVAAAAPPLAANGEAARRVKHRWPAGTTLTLAATALTLLLVILATQQAADGPLAAHAADSPSPTATVMALAPTPVPASMVGIGLVSPVPTIDVPTVTPTSAPTAAPTPLPTATPTVALTAPPTPRPTPRRTPAPTPRRTAPPTPAPKPMPALVVTGLSCDSPSANQIHCTSTVTPNVSGITYHWEVNGGAVSGTASMDCTGDPGSDHVTLVVSKPGYTSGNADTYVTVS